ncbi:bile acid:sodium symporter family protein [Brevibacillus migulae]|uniref:bile acid:sodium symporter family protein n=1 Tax=Brevibacillus migulae TaxID=1644114 RepID=UPI00106DDC02|nr:bile acid:sodium symporter family protein [Brevibacillus migulae]
MNRLQLTNRFLDKMMPVITPVSVVLGILFADQLGPLAFLSPWIFAFMTFAGSLGSNLREVGGVLARPLPILATLLVLHFVMPFLAWVVGHFMYPLDQATITGLVLATAIPTGITSMLWVSLYKGNLPLTLSIIVLDTLLSPFLVPFILSTLIGSKVELDIWGMMKGLFFMIGLPSVIAMLLNQGTKGKVKSWSPRLAPFSKIGVIAVVAINSSVVAPYLHHPDQKLIYLSLVVLLLMIVGYVLGWGVGKWGRWGKETEIALTFNCGMRNTNAGAVLAVTYFPPLVALPVVFGIIFQQLLASLFGFLQQANRGEKTASSRLET